MKLLTKSIEKKLKANMKILDVTNIKPVVKYFDPMGNAKWLILSMEYHQDEVVFFGLCDLGWGCPELGYVTLKELEDISRPFGLGIERDIYWTADKSISDYQKEAVELGYINT